MSVWTKDEAIAKALEMDSYYTKTKYEGYKYERDKWLEIAENEETQKVPRGKAVQ